jgi:hypothetical protein
MPPEVRYFILADQISASQNNLQRVNIQGLLMHLRVRGQSFPVVHPLFYVLVLLTNCSGSGNLQIRVVFDPTHLTIYQSTVHTIRFSGSPDDTFGSCWQVRNCTFPSIGLYFVECLFSGGVIVRQPLTVTR